MTADNQEPRAEDLINVNNTVILTNVPEGTRVTLRGGAVAEVTANPRDGGWVFIRYVEHPTDPSKVGEDDMAFVTDVTGIA